MLGFVGLFLVGLILVKMLVMVVNKLLIGINYLYVYIYVCWIVVDEEIFLCVGMIVSGGYSSFYCCWDLLDFDYLGGMIDDVVGEVFDKVVMMLGFGYLGGLFVLELVV